jgi:hypothetical protein
MGRAVDNPQATIDTGDHLPAVRSSAEWVAYFWANARRLLAVPWEAGAGMTAEERALIAASLPSRQLGESSDGARLLAAARHYAQRTGDPEFVEAIQLFIREEQRHGADLGRFLDLAGVPRKTWDWGDAVFRRLRHLLTRIELSACVLVTVEVHALIYYAAIRRATRSPVLRRVCEQILADEVPHVRFQCERLAILHRRRPRLLRSLTLAVHGVLFAGVTLAIWAGHRRALRAGGYSFRRFWWAAWAKMERAWRMMNPGAYSWEGLADTSGGTNGQAARAIG